MEKSAPLVPSSKRSAFTVIELLVVISIVALLISILLPSLVSARERARYIRWAGYSHNLRSNPDLIGYWNYEQQGEGELLWNRAAGNALEQARVDVEPEDFHGDFKTNGSAGALVPEWKDGRWKGKGALEFAGDNFVDVPHHEVMNPPDTFTVMTWANLYSGSVCWCSPLTSRDHDSPTYSVRVGFNLYSNPGNADWEFWTGSGGASWPQVSGTQPILDEWTLLVGTFERTSGADGVKKLYVNGQMESTATQAYARNLAQHTSAPLRIGAGQTSAPLGDYYWDGLIDETAVFQSVMTATTVEEVFRVGKSRVRD